MKKMLLILIVYMVHLGAATVDIVANWDVNDLPAKFENVKRDFNVRYVNPADYFVNISPYDPDLKKIIIFNPFLSEDFVSKLPKEKLVLFVWEPWYWLFHPHFFDSYSRVYTWDDQIVDGVKFFRFNYPFLMPMQKRLPKFEKKKLCTLVASNWTPQRIEIIKFFDQKPAGDFEYYGRGGPAPGLPANYKGAIAGGHSGDEKIQVLKKYRFCICFENHVHLKGYITEKIFGCFAAGCIPVYWGSTNIEQYIPKNCFIDFRDFQSLDHLYYYIKTMPKKVYEQYLVNIRNFLRSPEAQIFSSAYFDQILYQAIVQ